MSIEMSVAEATKRVLNLPNVMTSSVTKNDGDLLNSYLRGAAAFLKSIGDSESPPFFDASEMVASNEIVLDAQLDEMLKNRFRTHPSLTHGICRCYLKWAVLADRDSMKVLPFAHLYDPLIEILENGIPLISIRKGELVIGADELSVPLVGWRTR